MEFKEKMKLVKILEKKFEAKEEEEKATILEENRIFISDTTGIMGIIPKTFEMQELFKTFFEVNEEASKPNVNYIGQNEVENKSVYPTEFLVFINELLSVSSEHVTTFMNKDVPIKFETEDFILFLAPKVEK